MIDEDTKIAVQAGLAVCVVLICGLLAIFRLAECAENVARAPFEKKVEAPK